MKYLDGEPRSFTELAGTGSLRYRCIGYKCGDDKKARKVVIKLLAEIRTLIPDGVLIWRTRAEIYKGELYMRFVTDPPLPEEFWKKHEKFEGMPFNIWQDENGPT